MTTYDISFRPFYSLDSYTLLEDVEKVDDDCGTLQIVAKEYSEDIADDYTGVLEDYESFNS